MHDVVHSLDVESHGPEVLCAVTSSPSQLLYNNMLNEPIKVHQVDCRSASPALLQENMTIADTGKRCVSHMHASHELLVITRWDEGVFAYILGGGLKWKVSGKPPGMKYVMDASGIAADEQGHLFICDESNRCVHMLSARDGSHLGLVVRKGQEGIGNPRSVAWHQISVSLVVFHEKGGVYHLSIFPRIN